MQIKKRKNTNILATIGPATSSHEKLSKLMEAGADGFRLNFSHGAYETHKSNYDTIRQIEKETGKYIAILADMQGPKLRVGKFKQEAHLLVEKQKFRLDMNEELGDETRANLPHKEIFEAIKVGDELLVNDGNICLVVDACGKDFIDTTVKYGGYISSNKGVNLPNTVLNIAALTPKDLKDMEYALSLGVDYIGLSFVQTAEDVIYAKKLINGRAWVISKIEKPSAIDDLDAIVQESDVIMIARGDLGVECPIQSVPTLQKKIVATCRKFGKPVIVATQMLESMINNPMPTRAEVSDVANAVYEGVDTVMLSGETAVGKYPMYSVAMMKKIIENVESDSMYRTYVKNIDHLIRCSDASCAIPHAATAVSEVLNNVAAIASYTMTGKTTLAVAKERPAQPIIAISTNEAVARRLALVWGSSSFIIDEVVTDFDEMQKTVINIAKEKAFAKIGDYVVITAGVPFNQVGHTNLLQTVIVK